MEVTLNLPEKIYRNVSTAAKKSKRQLADLIVADIQEKYSSQTPQNPPANLSDEEVLALANLQMPKKQSERHSQLLDKNQAGTLKPDEKIELGFFPAHLRRRALAQNRWNLRSDPARFDKKPQALKLNNQIILPVRKRWIFAGWFPPEV